MSKKRHAATSENVPKRWCNNPAFFHWKHQVAVAEAEHITQKEKHDQIERDYRALQAKHDKEERRMERVRDDHSEVVTRAAHQVKLAKMRCKDPIFKYLTHVIKTCAILELISEYNANAICEACESYMPRATSCQKSKGHMYADCITAPQIVAERFCKWPNETDQEMWNDMQSMLTKTKTLRQVTSVFKLDRHPAEAIPVMCLQSNRLSVQSWQFRPNVVFEIRNVLPERKTPPKKTV